MFACVSPSKHPLAGAHHSPSIWTPTQCRCTIVTPTSHFSLPLGDIFCPSRSLRPCAALQVPTQSEQSAKLLIIYRPLFCFLFCSTKRTYGLGASLAWARIRLQQSGFFLMQSRARRDVVLLSLQICCSSMLHPHVRQCSPPNCRSSAQASCSISSSLDSALVPFAVDWVHDTKITLREHDPNHKLNGVTSRNSREILTHDDFP